MKAINVNYVLVEKLEKEQVDGFQSVEVQDDFVYKGKVKRAPMQTVYVDNHQLTQGDVILFSKYSPDTHEVDGDKFIKVSDILAVL